MTRVDSYPYGLGWATASRQPALTLRAEPLRVSSLPRFDQAQGSPVIRHGLVNEALHDGDGAVAHVRVDPRPAEAFDRPLDDGSADRSPALADHFDPDFVEVAHSGHIEHLRASEKDRSDNSLQLTGDQFATDTQAQGCGR